jgi:hypothetical protein
VHPRTGHATGPGACSLTGLLFTSRRAMADVLDLGAEAAAALTTITVTVSAAALGALLPPSGAITHAGPYPASFYPSSTGQGTSSRPRRGRLRVVPDPTPDPIRCAGGEAPVMSLPEATPLGSLRERGGEAVAGLILHTAALTLGAVAVLGAPAQTAARSLAGPLRLNRAEDDLDSVPDTVRAAARATDHAAGRVDRRMHLADTPGPAQRPSPTPRQRRRSRAERALEPTQ